MSVQFEEEQQLSRTPVRSSAKGMTALVISWGLAKDEKSAQTILLITAGAAFVLALGVWVFASPARPAVSPERYQDPARVTIPPARTP